MRSALATWPIARSLCVASSRIAIALPSLRGPYGALSRTSGSCSQDFVPFVVDHDLKEVCGFGHRSVFESVIGGATAVDGGLFAVTGSAEVDGELTRLWVRLGDEELGHHAVEHGAASFAETVINCAPE